MRPRRGRGSALAPLSPGRRHWVGMILTAATFGGLPFVILAVLFAGLKLTGVIARSWCWRCCRSGAASAEPSPKMWVITATPCGGTTGTAGRHRIIAVYGSRRSALCRQLRRRPAWVIAVRGTAMGTCQRASAPGSHSSIFPSPVAYHKGRYDTL